MDQPTEPVKKDRTRVKCHHGTCQWSDYAYERPNSKELRIPHCPKHGLEHLTVFGALHGVLAQDAELIKPPPPPDPIIVPALHVDETVPESLVQTDLWTHFCAVLDSSRVLMAGMNYSNAACRTCEEHNPHARPGCTCACHVAWRYRKAIEEAAARSEAAKAA